jgi:hypothetical protein
MSSYQIYIIRKLLYMHPQYKSKLNHKHIGDISTTNQMHVCMTNVFVMCSKEDSQGRELQQQQGCEQESDASCEQREHLQQQNCEGLRGEAVGEECPKDTRPWAKRALGCEV